MQNYQGDKGRMPTKSPRTNLVMPDIVNYSLKLSVSLFIMPIFGQLKNISKMIAVNKGNDVLYKYNSCLNNFSVHI